MGTRGRERKEVFSNFVGVPLPSQEYFELLIVNDPLP